MDLLFSACCLGLAAAEMSREQQDLLAAAVTKPGEYALKSGSTNVNMEIINIHNHKEIL